MWHPVVANMTRQFGYALGLSVITLDYLFAQDKPSEYTYAEPVNAHNTPIYYSPQQQYISPHTYQSHNALYDHRLNIIFDRPWQDD
jgi:hypothetical protein